MAKTPRKPSAGLTVRDWGLIAAAAALLLDQGSKFLLLYGFGFIHSVGEQYPLLPFLNLVMVWNPGVSFGLFAADGPEGTVFLATFSLIAVGGLGWWLWRATRRELAIGLGLVIGGAIGNLIDRLVYGKVADFFQFYAMGYHWYVFNVADAAITFGVIALLFDALGKPEARADGAG
jgi:signal peptidase II